MRKGIGRYEKSPIYNLPQPVPVTPEVFTDITDVLVPNVRPYYMISNYGRVFHKFSNRFLAPSIDSKGYLYTHLQTIDSTPATVRIHRLVLLAFNPIPNCDQFIANHLDGNKCNPHIWNLEWATESENMQHAYNTGLVDKMNSLTPEMARLVCQTIQDHPELTLQEISAIINVPYSKVQSIQSKKTYTYISDEYNLPERKAPQNLNIEEIHNLCLWFQSNQKPKSEILNDYCTRALQFIGYPNPGTNLVRTAKKIYAKETYKYISCYYNF